MASDSLYTYIMYVCISLCMCIYLQMRAMGQKNHCWSESEHHVNDTDKPTYMEDQNINALEISDVGNKAKISLYEYVCIIIEIKK